jgi:hypothetical protein
MDSKCLLRESSHPFDVSCPFMDQCTQMNQCAHEPVHLSTFVSLGTYTPSCPLGPTCPSLLVHLMIHLILGKVSWCVRAPKAPTCPNSVTLGCRSNPKFHLLEDLGEGVCALLVGTLHPSPPKVVFVPKKSTKSLISKYPSKILPPLQLSLLETQSFM